MQVQADCSLVSVLQKFIDLILQWLAFLQLICDDRNLLNMLCWRNLTAFLMWKYLIVVSSMIHVEAEWIKHFGEISSVKHSVPEEQKKRGNRINLFTCKLVDGECLDLNNQANEGTWGLCSIRNLHAVLSIQLAII